MSSREEILARILEEIRRRQATGESPRPEDFREEAGEFYQELLGILEQERILDRAIREGTQRFPRIFGEYTLLELLGKGGVGNVYKALQRPLSRVVALKILRGAWVDDPELLGRFQRGARAAAQVEHDNVVRVYDYGVLDGWPYIAMNFLEGPSLAKILATLREAGRPPFGRSHHGVLDSFGIAGEGDDTAAFETRIASLLAEPASALELYHARGIVHRDVKPSNLLLDGHGRLVLADFDLAKRLDTAFRTEDWRQLGTPVYMSPEQWDPHGREIDGRADVYSMGVVLYETLTLRVPFEESEPTRLMQRVATETPARPRALVPDLSDPAERIVMKAMERRREDRYASAQALAEDLRALAHGRPVVARPVPAARRAGRWARERRIMLLAVAPLLALALGWWFFRPATLHVLPIPTGEVLVDDESVGSGAVRGHRVWPGDHEVRVQLTGFRAHREHVKCEPGGSYALRPRLVPFDPAAPDVLDVYRRELGLPLPMLREPPLQRTTNGPRPAVPVLPRGAVRLSDLNRLVAEIEEPGEVTVVLREEGGRELLRMPSRTESSVFAYDLTGGVLALLHVGGRYEWTLNAGEHQAETASFEIVADLDEAVAVKLRSSFPGDASGLAALFEIAVLQERGLHVAALRRAFETAKDWKHPIVYRAAWASIEALRIERTHTGEDILRDYIEATGQESR